MLSNDNLQAMTLSQTAPVAEFDIARTSFRDVDEIAIKSESADATYLQADFDTTSGEFRIHWLNVDEQKRGRGIGKRLLELARQEAQTNNAKYVLSDIATRECLDAMTTVFGAEHITVAVPGEYGQVATDAQLRYPIESTI